MGRSVFAEENLFNYLKNLSKPNACSTGLILGQSSDTKDYVILLVRTPEQTEKELESSLALPATFQSIKEINETWIAEHAKHVTKMLPGGMWVLGIFICSPSDLFSDNSAQGQIKAKSILLLLKKHLSNEPLLHANNPSSNVLLLHLNTTDFKYSCKTLDARNITSTFQPADWKFQNNFTKWCQIYCNFDAIQPPFGGNMSCPVKDQLKNALNEVNKKLEKAMVTLNGQIRNSNETLETFIKKESSKDLGKVLDDLPILKASIFLSFEKEEISKNDIMIKDCDVELHLQGILASRVFLSQKSTIAEAISAVKQDLVRSLAARFEMHWDSLVEEEYGSPEEKLSVHEPPRRVSVILPQSKIALNDYLFPGEGAAEVISSFKEMLDLDISENNLEKEIESQGDPMEFYGSSSLSLTKNLSNEFLSSSTPKLFLFSVGIILIAIAIALFMKTEWFQSNLVV